MIRLALRSLAARPLRTALTALAVVLGVAMVSAAFTITDTMRGAADSLSRAAYDGTDAVVGARTAFEVDAGDWTAKRPTVDAGLLDRVRAVPGVAVAAADITDEAKVIGRDGKPIGDGPVLRRRARRQDAGRRRADAVPPLRRSLGRRAGRGRHRHRHGGRRGPPGRQHGHDHHARRAARLQGRRDRELRQRASRWARRRSPSSTSARPRRCSAAGTGSTGSSSPAATASRPRSCGRTWRGRSRRRASPPPPGRTASRSTGSSSSSRSSGSRCWCSAASRCSWARSRSSTRSRSPSRSGRASSACCGWRAPSGARCSAPCWPRRWRSACSRRSWASLAGLGLAKALDAFFDSIGLALPEAGTVFGTRTIVVSLLLGTLVTLIAGLVPAWRATRVPPVAALRAAEPGAGRVRLPARAARGLASLLGRPAQARRRRGRRARAAQRDAPAGPHDGDRRRADDRRRARDARHRRRRGPEGHDARRARAPARRRLRGHRRGRLVADRPGRRARGRRHRAGDRHPPGPRARVRRQGDRQLARRRPVPRSTGSRATTACRRRWATTARSSTRAGREEHGLAVGDRFTLTSAKGVELPLTVRGIEGSPLIDATGPRPGDDRQAGLRPRVRERPQPAAAHGAGPGAGARGPARRAGPHEGRATSTSR